MTFNPEGIATAIGSFPYIDSAATCEFILSTFPEIPFWPQLPNADFREQMEVQYCEGLPRLVLNEEEQRIYFDTSGDYSSDLEKFYENVISENLDYFKISRKFSSGIYEMEKKLSRVKMPSVKYFKSQITGPLTLGLSITDENRRAIYYNEVFRDVIVKAVIMKARWLLHKFKPLGFRQICFVDEPILSAYGSSAYVSVQRHDVVSCLNEVASAIHKEGFLAGTHCCGNTEWPILIDGGVDIISFDAYEFSETIGYYPDAIKLFLERGGVLSWGIVPTSDKINNETPWSLVEKLDHAVRSLASKGININLLWERCLLTPSCGTGSISVEMSAKVYHCLSEVSRIIRGRKTISS